MALEVIGAGLGRNATLSTKFALEHLGYGPCYHMVEVFAEARRNVPLWLDVIAGRPDWDAIFSGYRSTTDNPACNYWRELAEYYPQAKVLLTVRDADSWFDSVSETIYAPRMIRNWAGTPIGDMYFGTCIAPFAEHIADRAHMTDWYERRNQEVIDTIAPERLLVFLPKQGWEPLCAFLDVPVPPEPFPRVNSRDELGGKSDEAGGIPSDLAVLEEFARAYREQMRAAAMAR